MMFHHILSPTIIALLAFLPYIGFATGAETVCPNSLATDTKIAIIYENVNYGGAEQVIQKTMCMNVDPKLDQQVSSYCILPKGRCNFYSGKDCRNIILMSTTSRSAIRSQYDNQVRSVACWIPSSL